MSGTEDKVAKSSHGIQELIDQLRTKGVSEGERQAQAVLDDAHVQAEKILADAKQEAQQCVQKAKEEAAFIEESGEQALRRTYRDIKLQLKEELVRAFSRQLQFLVSQELSDPDTLKCLLMSAAGKAQLQDRPMTIELPSKEAAEDDLREHPELLQSGPLLELVGQVTRELFESDVRIMGVEHLSSGARIELVDGTVSLDLSDDGLSALVLKHLQPRFRAILDGVVSS